MANWWFISGGFGFGGEVEDKRFKDQELVCRGSVAMAAPSLRRKDSTASLKVIDRAFSLFVFNWLQTPGLRPWPVWSGPSDLEGCASAPSREQP